MVSTRSPPVEMYSRRSERESVKAGLNLKSAWAVAIGALDA